MASRRKTILWFLEYIVECIVGILFSALIILIALQVLFRYVFNNPLYWSEELCRLALIFITMLGTVLALKRGEHITSGVDLSLLFPPQINRLKRKISKVLIIGLLLLIIYKGIELSLAVNISRSPALLIPLGYIIGIVPLSGILMLLVAIFSKADWLENNNKKGEL